MKAAFILLFPSVAFASVSVYETRSYLEQLLSARPMISPSSSVTTPVAYGVAWGTVFGGIAGQTGTQFTGRPFGEYAFGFGLGDPEKSVSLTTIITSGGLDEVIRDGNVNFQLSKHLSMETAIGVGIENALPWGADQRNKQNHFIVGSTLFTINFTHDYSMNIITSLGMGNTRFVHNYQTKTTNTTDVHTYRPFASLGLQVLPQGALIFDYVGLTYNAGVSIVPFLAHPLVVSLTAIDLMNRGGNHIPIAVSIGYSYSFK